MVRIIPTTGSNKAIIRPKASRSPVTNFSTNDRSSSSVDAVGTDVQMPATAEKVWKALKKNGSKKAAA